MIDLGVKIKSITFNNPLLTASGTFSEDHLELYKGTFPFGGVVLKTFTIEERLGNQGKRILKYRQG